MYEVEEQKADGSEMCVREPKPIAETMDETVDVLVEIHSSLSGLSEFLFGDTREQFERPTTKCLQDAAIHVNDMSKYVLERLMEIKRRIGA